MIGHFEYSYIDHANDLAEEFKLGKVTTESAQPHCRQSSIDSIQFITDHMGKLNDFSGSNEIHERTSTGVLIRPIAYSGMEDPEIGIIKLTAAEGSRRFVVDGGIQRFLRMLEGEDDSFLYLMNSFLFLQ